MDRNCLKVGLIALFIFIGCAHHTDVCYPLFDGDTLEEQLETAKKQIMATYHSDTAWVEKHVKGCLYRIRYK